MKIRPLIRKFLLHFAHHDLARSMIFVGRMRAQWTANEYIEANMHDKPYYPTSEGAMLHALKEVTVKGLYLEFGVFTGISLRHIEKNTPEHQEIHGFDSFEGLPGYWSPGYNKNLQVKKIPTFSDRVKLHVGWFDDTVPVFKLTNPGEISFIHFDADMYESTKTVFDQLGGRIVPGTVIIFDNYFGFQFWRQHEYRALQEFIMESGLSYEYLCYTDQKCAIKIK